MKILWVINIPLPEASEIIGEKSLPYGGWLVNASNELSKNKDIELTISYPSQSHSEFKELKGKRITYYPFSPAKKIFHNKNNEIKYFELLLDKIKPDIVHVYGTEMNHSLAMIKACTNLGIKNVVSIQGLVSVIEKHMYANLPFKAIYGMTLRNLIFKDSVYGLRKKFKQRGHSEVEGIKIAKNIIGRTTWDKACVQQISPGSKYFFCNETLREEFYKHLWDINDCERYSIFLSQGQYSIKGLHHMLEAMPLIIKKFPDTKLYVGGKNITDTNSLKSRISLTYYGKYIKRLIEKYNLQKNVVFTGLLNEKKMCNHFLNSHVFVCPSSIENSPNSLGEAMLLGVPCVASNVGGITDMMTHNKEGYIYQPDASYMLAHYVCEIFENDDLATEFSSKSRLRALSTHNKLDNLNELMSIYRNINLETEIK
ncbi:glycosyltransferase family 4 protein [Exiguobacterium sp. s50]|uniref:glycosyltransferase family 4 protein n=1 Tax=Exiguobacterium sp. s50 TaxID=2751234 RepID=UPI001BE90558|nr:glycosyltransferase [Exiguobacterium sp. s50]